MNLNIALVTFKDMLNRTDSKSESKIYQIFIDILSNLISRTFEADELTAIESKLDALNLAGVTGNRKRYFRKRLSELTTYLDKEFSLVTEGHYSRLYMVYGMMFGSGIGLTFGTAFGAGLGTSIGLSTGVGIGMALGIAFGTAKDAEAKKQNRVLAE
jgi:hypothetical protein